MSDEARLPVELQEIIVSHLENDRNALFVCALVCRTWLSWSRSRIPAALRLFVRRGHLTLKRGDITKLLTSPDSTLHTFVKKLVIKYQSSPSRVGYCSDWEATLIAIAQHLPIESISFVYFRITNKSGYDLLLKMTSIPFPHLTQIGLFGLLPTERGEFASFITSLPHLRRLILSWVEICDDEEPVDKAPPQLSHLAYNGHISNQLLLWLSTGKSLQTMSVSGFSTSSYSTLSSCFHTLGPSLRELCLLGRWSELESLDFTPLTELEGFWFGADGFSLPFHEVLPLIFRALMLIPSTRIATLNIDLYGVFLQSGVQVAHLWQRFNDIIREPKFTSLKRIRFLTTDTHAREIESEFAEWAASRVLEVSDDFNVARARRNPALGFMEFKDMFD